MQVFTCVLVLGLCFAAFVITDIRGYKERKASNTVSIAQVIGSTSISALQFLDNASARKILSDLQKVEPDIVNASILDKKGNVFAPYTKPGNTSYKFQPPFSDSYKFAGSFLYVYKNIISDNEIFGTVCLQVELSQLEQIKNQKFKIAVVLLVVGIAVAFLIATLTQRYISRPLLSLVTEMKDIRESGDYSRQVSVKGKDEITTLSLEFNNLMDQIKISLQKKDEFIGIASHELKTPLTSAKGFLELLNKMELELPAESYVKRALNGVNKLQNLIFDLLDVSKIQSGQLQVNKEEFNIDELIDECINSAQMNTSLHKRIIKQAESANKTIFADRHRIEQVINNLLSNAIKYSPQGKNIIVQMQNSESGILVSVKDFGIGVPKSEHEKIFDRFYRANVKNVGISGFGLGLYICSQIIRQHNGRIWVESEEGNGAIFYFELPVEKAVML